MCYALRATLARCLDLKLALTSITFVPPIRILMRLGSWVIRRLLARLVMIFWVDRFLVCNLVVWLPT